MSWRDMVREDCLLLYFSFMFVSSYFIYDFYMIKIWERERERGKAWGKMVPRSLEIRSSFGHQSLMSWRHKGKRRLSSLYFLLSIFFFIILCDFYMIKIWERERGREHGIYALRVSLRALLLNFFYEIFMKKIWEYDI